MTNGGPELAAAPGVVPEPVEDVLAELEHAPSNSAAAKHAAAARPDCLTVLIMCIPLGPLAALPEREHVS
jgi:hypothetical protein